MSVENDAEAVKRRCPPGWNFAQVRDISDVVRGASPRPAGSPLYFDGDYMPWITVSEVTGDSSMYLTSTKTCLTEQGAAQSRVLEVGTLILTNSGATLGVPKITLIRAAANDGIAALINLREVEPKYLYYCLQSNTQYLREVVAPGNGQPNLNTELIGEIELLLPPLVEQQRIAEIFENWDAAIATTEMLLANSCTQKKALTYDLLMGRVRRKGFARSARMVTTRVGRLPQDWKHVPIGELASEISVKNVADEKLPVLSCTKHLGLVDSLSYFNKRVFSENTSTYKVVPRGAFAYATNHIDEGSIGYQNLYDCALISPMYTVFEVKARIDHGFLFRLLKTEHYRQVFAANTNASVDRRGSLRWSDFKKIEIPVPSLEEQLAINEVLKSADQEIKQLAAQLEALKAEKRALMSDLLTGKRRVRLPETAPKEQVAA